MTSVNNSLDRQIMGRWIRFYWSCKHIKHRIIDKPLEKLCQVQPLLIRSSFRRSGKLKTTKYGNFLQAFWEIKGKMAESWEILPGSSFFRTYFTFLLNFSFLFSVFHQSYLFNFSFLICKTKPTFQKSIFSFNSFF